MISAWGDSWSDAWDDSWGAGTPPPPITNSVRSGLIVNMGRMMIRGGMSVLLFLSVLGSYYGV